MRAWLSQHHGDFQFLRGARLTRLRLEVDSSAYRCPICLDTEPGLGLVISRCGHYTCLSCALRLARMNGRYGTLCNLLSYAKHVCPECRCPRPFVGMKTLPPHLATALIDANFSV